MSLPFSFKKVFLLFFGLVRGPPICSHNIWYFSTSFLLNCCFTRNSGCFRWTSTMLFIFVSQPLTQCQDGAGPQQILNQQVDEQIYESETTFQFHVVQFYVVLILSNQPIHFKFQTKNFYIHRCTRMFMM